MNNKVMSFLEELKAAGVPVSKRTQAAINELIGQDVANDAVSKLAEPMADAIATFGIEVPEGGLDLRVTVDTEGKVHVARLGVKAPRKSNGNGTGATGAHVFKTEELLKTYGAVVANAENGKTFQTLYDELYGPGKVANRNVYFKVLVPMKALYDKDNPEVPVVTPPAAGVTE